MTLEEHLTEAERAEIEGRKRFNEKLKSLVEWAPFWGNYLLKKELRKFRKENVLLKKEYAKSLAARLMLEEKGEDDEKKILTSFYEAVGCDGARLFIISYANNVPWVSRVLGIDKRRGNENIFDPEYTSAAITDSDKFSGRILPLVVLNKKPYHLDLTSSLKDYLYYLPAGDNYDIIKDEDGKIKREEEKTISTHTMSKILENLHKSVVNKKEVKEKVEVPIFEDFKDEDGNTEKRVIGVLVADNAESGFKISDNRIETMISTAKSASLSIASARKSKEDELTGVYNRRGLNQYLIREGTNSLNTDEPLSVAMLDIDHFKNFNDSYGHPTGDLVLKKIASLIQGSIRQGMKRKRDIVARYGGEEFTIIFPNTDKQGAKRTAEIIRETIAEYDLSELIIKSGKSLDKDLDSQITISGGVADLDTILSDEDYRYLFKGAKFFSEAEIKPLADMLVDNADKALYKAKNNGRNQICVYGK